MTPAPDPIAPAPDAVEAPRANMILSKYLAALQAARTGDELEAALQARFQHPFTGRTRTKICRVRREVGQAICDAHPHGNLVPRFGPQRILAVCGETYKVGQGHNSTGDRYVWTYAQEWAEGVLVRRGLSKRAAQGIWDWWASGYPHRCLSVIEKALAGEMPDPPMNTLIFNYEGPSPVRITAEENDEHPHGHRATRPCDCGGTLFDWGSGWNGYLIFINWHCNACPRVFTEYVTSERLREIRNLKSRPVA
jgi:hypothetical protein